MTSAIGHENINCPLPAVGSPDWGWTNCTVGNGIILWTSSLVPWDVIETRSRNAGHRSLRRSVRLSVVDERE